MPQFCDHCGLPAEGGSVEGEDGHCLYCCYGCRMIAETIGSEETTDGAGDAHRALLYRLFAGVLMAGFVMAFSLAISSGYGFGALRSLTHDVRTAHWVLLVAAVPALVLLGTPVVTATWHDLREGRLTLNVLFALGTSSAVGVSLATYIRGTGPIYLETAVMLLALYTLGRYLTARAKGTATRVLGRLLEVPDTTYLRLNDESGSEADVPGDALATGDRVRIRAGDVLPVDGTVVEGRSYVDESSLTGEARPAVKGPGDEVFAGTSTLDGSLVIRATAAGDDRRLARVEAMMRRALEEPPRIAQLTDRIMRWLIPGVVVLALATFGVWWWIAGFAKALYVALSVVLITCPCALGIAIPLTLVVGLKEASRHGVLVRSGRTLLDLAQTDAFVFDKTGTLTTLDTPSVQVIAAHCASTTPVPESAAPGSLPEASPGTAEDDLLTYAAAVERGTNHALATAIVREAERRRLSVPAVGTIRTHAGSGVAGTIHLPNKASLRVGVGNEALVETMEADCPGWLHDRAADHRENGETVLFVIVDDTVAGLITLQEQLRDTASTAVHLLRNRDAHVSILTGDRAAAGRRIGSHLDVPVDAGLSPDEKVGRLARLRNRHTSVAAIGDGINDAAVLAAADVGIALSSGASVSLEAADVTLYNPDLRLIPWLSRLSNRLDRIIRQNLIWTFGYNGIGLGLAVFGLLHPLVAVAIMTVSSLIVTWNAFRVNTLPAPGDLVSA